MSYTKPISWHLFSMAKTCPKKAEFYVKKTPYLPLQSTEFARIVLRAKVLGILVQKIFEVFYNREINLSTTDHKLWLFQTLESFMSSNWFTEIGGDTLTVAKEVLRHEAMAHIERGYHTMVDMGMVGHLVRSEVNLYGAYRKLRMSGRLDFLVELDRTTVEVYDGKGSRTAIADSDQLLFYTHMLNDRTKVVRAGFIYWQRGFQEIDVSTQKSFEFLRDRMVNTMPIINELEGSGIPMRMKAKPGPHCKICDWNGVCPEAFRE